MHMQELNLERLSDVELIDAYIKTIKTLKERGIIQSKNVIGDIGEYLVLSHYNNTPGLPNLQRAPKGTKNVDALSREGELYSIKATSGTATGAFFGLHPPNSEEKDRKVFEYLVVVVFDKDYVVKNIIEIDWNQFLLLKRWHSRMKAWNIPITAELGKIGKIRIP